MSNHHVFELTLRAILDVLKPLHEDSEIRVQIINELCGVVATVEGLRDASVEPFGSFLSNLYTRWGDLDISIELPNGSNISSAEKKQKRKVLGSLLRALRQNGGWQSLQLIPNARVPILKSVSNRQGVSCDISVDNLRGLVKSKFLFWISEIDDRFRDMVLLVKEWAKAHDINNPRAGTFNSYSLSLLVIFHFQTCVPAIFPPLKEIYPRNVADDLTGVRNDAVKNVSDTCAAQIARLKSDKTRAVNQSSISELFLSFLAKFSDLSSKASQFAICPFTGNWEDLQCNTRRKPKRSAIFIEDPFEQPENTARSVCQKHLQRISRTFLSTYHKLNATHENQNAVIIAITTPQVSRSVLRTQVDVPPVSHFVPRRPVYNPSHVASPRANSHSYRPAHGSTGVPRARAPAINVGYGYNGGTQFSSPSYNGYHGVTQFSNPSYNGYHGGTQFSSPSYSYNGYHGNTQFSRPSYNGYHGTVYSPSSSYESNYPPLLAAPHLYMAQHQAQTSRPRSYSGESYRMQTPTSTNFRHY